MQSQISGSVCRRWAFYPILGKEELATHAEIVTFKKDICYEIWNISIKGAPSWVYSHLYPRSISRLGNK